MHLCFIFLFRFSIKYAQPAHIHSTHPATTTYLKWFCCNYKTCQWLTKIFFFLPLYLFTVSYILKNRICLEKSKFVSSDRTAYFNYMQGARLLLRTINKWVWKILLNINTNCPFRCLLPDRACPCHWFT